MKLANHDTCVQWEPKKCLMTCTSPNNSQSYHFCAHFERNQRMICGRTGGGGGGVRSQCFLRWEIGSPAHVCLFQCLPFYPILQVWSSEVSAVSAAIHNSVNYQPVFFFLHSIMCNFFSLATPQHLSTQSGWGGGGGAVGGALTLCPP